MEKKYEEDPHFHYELINSTSLVKAIHVVVWILKARYTKPPTYDNVHEIIRTQILKYRPDLYKEEDFTEMMFLLKEDFLFRDFLLSKRSSKCCCNF